MKRDGVNMLVAFPKYLMSAARSAVTMSPEFGREILNMYATADGAGSKRNGVVRVGDALDGEVICGLFSYVKAGTGLQLLAVTASGKIKLHTGGAWSEVWTGLDTRGVPRAVNFANRLVLVNGIDPVMAWDGDAWTVVSELVADVAAGLTYLSPTQFSIESTPEVYAVGTVVRARLATGMVTATVSAVGVVGDVVTVTLGTAVLDNTLDQVAYTARPPAFAYIYAAHDRLWGFGKGPLSGQGLSADPDRARVYYTYGVNDETAWHDPEGVIGEIGLADKSPGSDELVAMAVKDGVTVFLLKNSMQIWGGSTPGADGDFGWQKSIPVGAVHGDLVVELPNDIAFLTRNGVRSLSRALQTEQLDVSDVGSEVDPLVAQRLEALMADDDAFRAVRSVVCARQSWLGVCLRDRTMVFQVGGAAKGWAMFDGIFSGAGAFCATPDGRLHLAKGGQLYLYDDNVWDDDGEPIMTRWWTPWLRFARSGKQWANRYVEVLSGRGAPMELALRRYRNLDDGDDMVLTVQASVVPDYWDTGLWDQGGWDNSNPTPPAVRDHFVADEVAWAVESNTTLGPLTLFGLKVYGVPER